VLPAGALPDNPAELLGSPRLDELRDRLLKSYDLVIIDSPVLLAVSDGLLLASAAEGTLVVHKPGSLEKRALERMKTDLHLAGANVLGVVFNQVDRADRYAYPLYMESPYITDTEPGGRARGAADKEAG